jgi:2-polyprenyl-6-hydroxyphenyl methylase/3-demethylubiquinone-9 3-methyltransferase
MLFDVVDFNKSCAFDLYPFGTADVLVTYLRCSVCQFVFTTFLDDWTSEDFGRFIYNEDYVKVDGEYAGIRPEREAAAIAQRLEGRKHLRILDYGSGSGRFAAELRSRGFETVQSYDPFSSPVRPEGMFDVITCFEVLEHTVSPHVCLDDIVSFLKDGGCILFSTGIQPPNIGELRANWWYVAPRNGHVSIYSLNSLARLGRGRGLTLHAGEGLLAYGDAKPCESSREILAGVGRALQFFVMTAPGLTTELSPDQRHLWHGAEKVPGNGTSYRWTANSTIAWTLLPHRLEPCDLIVSIPLRNEVQPGFADRCHVEIGPHSAPMKRHAEGLQACLRLDESMDAVVRLVTPPVLRPCDLRPVSDARRLGLAIATASS